MNFTAINRYFEEIYEEYPGYDAPCLSYDKAKEELSASVSFLLPYKYFKPENAKELDYTPITYDDKTLTVTQSNVDFDNRHPSMVIRSFVHFAIRELIVNPSFYQDSAENWNFGYAYELLNIEEYPPQPAYIQHFSGGSSSKYILDEFVDEHLIQVLWDLGMLFQHHRWSRYPLSDSIIEFLIQNELLVKAERMTDKTEMDISELLQYISDNNIQRGDYEKKSGIGSEGVHVYPNEIKIRGRVMKGDMFYINE